MPDIGIRTDTTSGPNSDGILSKTPDEVVIKTVEFSGLLDTGETVSAVASTTVTRQDGTAIDGSDLTVDSSAASGTKAQLTLSAGRVDIDYNIVVRVTTSNSQTLEGKVRMIVRDP